MGFLGGEWHDQIHVLLIALERMNRLSGNKEGLQGAIARETETATCLGTKCDSGIFQVSFSCPLWHGAGLSFPFPWRVVGSANIKPPLPGSPMTSRRLVTGLPWGSSG